MKRILLTSAAACAAVCLAACRMTSSHAPTFNDLHEFSTVLDPNALVESLQSERVKELGEHFRAMQFTAEDLGRIRDSGDIRLLTGAAAATDADSPLARALLFMTYFKMADDPSLLAAFAYMAVMHHSDKLVAESEFLPHLDWWRELEPENSVPYYLEMAWWAECEDFDKAARALAEASRHPKFDTHSAALRQDAVAAAEFVGYPKFTARLLALLVHGEMRLSIAARHTLDREGVNEQIAYDCIVLGKRMEAEKAGLTGEMSGLGLQLVAMKKFPQTGSAAEVKRIEERRKQINEVCAGTNALLATIPEKRYVAYLDEVLAGNEAAANEKLLSEYKRP